MSFRVLLKNLFWSIVATSLYACSVNDNSLNSPDADNEQVTQVSFSSISIKNGAMQKVPFELSVDSNTQTDDISWYLNGSQTSLPVMINEERTLRLTGKKMSTNEIVSTVINAIDPQLVASFEVEPSLDKNEYVYQNKNSTLSGVSLYVPKGAVSENTIIELKESSVLNIPNTDGIAISKLLTLEPSGLKFNKPIIIRLPYEGDFDPRNIVVASYSDGGIVDIDRPLSVDEENKVVTFSATHFTEFVLQTASYTFVNKPKSRQTVIQEIEDLLGVVYTNEEWEQILNEPIEKTDLTVYDLYLQYQKLALMYSLIPSDYTKAVKAVFPNSSSALQEQVKAVESISDALKPLEIGLSFSPEVLTSGVDTAEFILSSVASYWDIPTSVSDLTSLDLYKPGYVVNNLSNEFNKIDNVFYEELWGEFNNLFSLGKDEDDFMRGEFTPENELLLGLMEDSTEGNLKLKALLTPGMIHNLKLVYLKHKHFHQNKGILLENLKKTVASVYEAETKNIKILPKNHNKYYVNSEYIPSFLFQTSGYGSEGFKSYNPTLELSFEGQVYSFSKEDFSPYRYGLNGFIFDESSNTSINQFVLSKKIKIPNQAKNVQMNYKYKDESGIEKEGIYYVKYISPAQVSLSDYDYNLKKYAGAYRKSIFFTPSFAGHGKEYIEYTTRVTLGDRTDEGRSFVLTDGLYNSLVNQSSASQADLGVLANLIVTFSAVEGARFTFESRSFKLNLIELWDSLEQSEIELDWSTVAPRYPEYPQSTAVSTSDSIRLVYSDDVPLSNNIDPISLDLDGDGIYDQVLERSSQSVNFSFSNSGISGPSCIEFQHKSSKEIKRVCTEVRLTLENGSVLGNTTPIAKNKSIVLSSAQETEISLYGYDSDNDDLIYRITANPKSGSIISLAGNKVIYNPDIYAFYSDNGYADSFSYVVNDGVLDSSPRHIKINRGEPIVLTDNEVSLNLSEVTRLEEGESTVLATGLQGEVAGVACIVLTSAGEFDLTSFGGSLSNNKTSIYITAPLYSEKPHFKLTCSVKDSFKTLATDSIDITVSEKLVVPPTVINQIPTVSLPSYGVISQSNVKIIDPIVTDDELSTVKYEWQVDWLGDNKEAGSPSGIQTSSKLELSVPAIQPGQSGSVKVTLKVTDAEGEVAEDTSTYTYQLEKIEELGETRWDFNDGDTLERGSKSTLSWVVRNVGNVDLIGVNLKLSTEIADKLNVGNISPSYIAEWKEGETKTFEVIVEAPNDVLAGKHKQEWYFTHNGMEEELLPYRNSTDAAYLSFEFLTVDPADLLAKLLISSKIVEPDDVVYGSVEVHSGNQPYTFTVDWGDGSDITVYPGITEKFVREEITYARQPLEHSYSTAGEYTVTVTVTDAAGKSLVPPLRDTIGVSTSKVTSWSADVRDISTSEHEENIPVISESYSNAGVTMGRYYTNWSPSVSLDSQEYFVKYRLPVPKNILSLSKKVRLAASIQASGIAAHDRELTFRTQSGKEFSAVMVDIDHTEDGFLRKRDLLTNKVDISPHPILVDDVKDTKPASYSLIIEPSKMAIWRDLTDDTDSKELALLSDSFGSEYISEIDITFKGNGVVEELVLQYDKNENGAFTDDESIHLNTVGKNVDWNGFGNDDIQPPEIEDQALLKCINENGGLSADIRELACNIGEGILDISPLSAFLELSSVTLKGNLIADISVLSTLLELSSIDISDNPVSDISGLSELPNLATLIVSGACITDFSAISENVNIVGKDDQTCNFGSTTQATGMLNDTGITQCSDGESNGLSCPVEGYPDQDAKYGRDALSNDDSDGHAGFSFTKLDVNGNELSANASEWSCVEDNVTGLIWEVKQNEGLHDSSDTYTWYSEDESNNGGFVGYEIYEVTRSVGILPDGTDLGSTYDISDNCYGYDNAISGSYCNTQAFVERVNKAGLCGAKDWRLPSQEILLSIVSFDRVNPAIDTDYFPKTRISYQGYWSSSPNTYSDRAGRVDFYRGLSSNSLKSDDSFVRLVRSGEEK